MPEGIKSSVQRYLTRHPPFPFLIVKYNYDFISNVKPQSIFPKANGIFFKNQI